MSYSIFSISNLFFILIFAEIIRTLKIVRILIVFQIVQFSKLAVFRNGTISESCKIWEIFGICPIENFL